MTAPSGWRFFVKTAVDRAAAAVGIVAVAPVLVGAAAAVRVSTTLLEMAAGTSS